MPIASPPLILVVEDLFVLAIAMQGAVEVAGFRAATAVSPEETRARLRQEVPSVAVVDLNLRDEMDGVPLAHELAGLGGKIIISSAYARGQLTLPLPEIVAYLRKPVASEQLVSAVRTARAG